MMTYTEESLPDDVRELALAMGRHPSIRTNVIANAIDYGRDRNGDAIPFEKKEWEDIFAQLVDFHANINAEDLIRMWTASLLHYFSEDLCAPTEEEVNEALRRIGAGAAL